MHVRIQAWPGTKDTALATFRVRAVVSGVNLRAPNSLYRRMREISRPLARPPSAVLPLCATTQPGSLAPVCYQRACIRGCECRTSHRRIACLLNVWNADGRAPSQSNRQSKAIASFSYGAATPATPNGRSEINSTIPGRLRANSVTSVDRYLNLRLVPCWAFSRRCSASSDSTYGTERCLTSLLRGCQ